MYVAGIWLKGFDGVAEMIGGALLLLASKAALGRFVTILTRHELSEDPTDWIAMHAREAVNHLSRSTKLFASVYLIGHGVVKIFLVWGGLLRGRMWAFPTAIAFMAIFIAYQSYRVIHRFSIGLLSLTLIDFIILVLICREYRLRRKA